MKNLFRNTLMSLFTFSVVFAFANPSDQVSNEDLEKFANIYLEINKVDQLAQNEMVETITNEGMDVEVFNDMMNAYQNPDETLEASNEELQQFQEVATKVVEIHNNAQEEMQQVILDNGFSVEKYQEVATAIQENPELQQKVQEYFQKG